MRELAKGCEPGALELARFVTPQRLRRIEAALDGRLASVCVVFEDLCDAHNVSAVLRSAEALGVQDVHLIHRAGRVKPHRHIALGAQRWLDVHHHDRLAPCVGGLQAAGFEVWGADPAPGALPLDAVRCRKPVALLFGSERVGLSRQARSHVDGRFFVPMRGLMGSLNVSVAAGIAMHAVTERRRAVLGSDGDLDPARRRTLIEAWLRRSVRRSGAILRTLKGRSDGDVSAT